MSGATLTFHDPQGNPYPGRGTTFISSSQLTHPFNNGSDAGQWTVFVVNPDGQTSNTWSFTVTAAVPGVPALTLTPECSGTASQIRLNWTAASGATSYDVYRNFAVYATGVTGTQYINTVVTPGTAYSYSVLARNSSGSTGSATQSATAPNCVASAPVINGLSPASYPASGSGQTLTVNGSNFVSAATLTFHDPQGNPYPGRGTTFISSSQLTHPFNNGSDAGSWNVQVINPDGQASNIWTFTVTTNTTAPHIDSMNPNPVPGSSSDQIVSILGNNFANGTTLKVHVTSSNVNTDLTGTQVNWRTAGQIDITIKVGTTADNWTATVINPDGQSSNVFPFSVRANTSGLSSVGGSVTSLTGAAVAGATVLIGNSSAQSDSQGSYNISGLSAGDYTATISKAGYSSISESITVPASTQVHKDFKLQPTVSTSNIAVSSVTSKYSGQPFFLDGSSKSLPFTANIDWGGHTPGNVQFVTPKGGTHTIATASSLATQSLNMGTEFGVCGKLGVQAISSDGTASTAKNGNFVIMSRPPLIPGFQAVDIGDSFYYQAQLGVNDPNSRLFHAFDELIAENEVPADVPLFGQKGFSLRYLPTVTAKVTSGGEADYDIDFEHKKFVEANFGVFAFQLNPKLAIHGQFSPNTCRWSWGGYVGAAASLEAKQTWPFVVPVGPVPVPMYLKASEKLEADLTIGVSNLDPIALNGQLNLKPSVTGSLGVGVNEVVAVEGSLTGGVEYKIQWPQTPRQDLTVFLEGKVSAYAFLWKWENQLLRWDYHKSFDGDKSSGSPAKSERAAGLIPLTGGPVAPRLLSRDYLKAPNYAQFIGGLSFDLNRRTGTASQFESSNNPITVQSNVFPHSEPSISASGNNLGIAWLYDDPARTSVNRSVAVFSMWDGTAWSDPKPIADDGTPDFHPQLLEFSDGSALAVWEDVKKVLPDTSTFDDMLSNLEVAASFFDAKTRTWSPSQRLTNNNYLDRSPKLSGSSSNNSMLVGVSNTANDVLGNSSKPNSLWFSQWNGTSWSSPQTIATVPKGIVKYDLTYTGSKADVVLSLDTDDDSSTNQDHELYSLHYENGVWGKLVQLTSDTVADDNPHLATDSVGSETLLWVRGDDVSSAPNLDVANRKTVANTGYSSNVADFKLATGADGRLSLVWAEPSGGFSSNLQALFYDPVTGVWGSQTELAADPQTKEHIAAALYGGKLFVIYDGTNLQTATQPQLRNNSVQHESIPTPGTTDLMMLTHTVGGNLGIKSNSLTVSPTNPRASELATLTAIVVNRGDVGAQDVPVSFYQGDPGAGGALLGTTAVSGILAPGEERMVSLPWTPQPATTPYSIYAVVDPNQTYADVDRSNNKASINVVKPDLALQSVKWDRLDDNSVIVTARVTNIGSVPSDKTTVSFRRDSSTGTLLASPSVGVLNPDESTDVAIKWDTTGLNGPEYRLLVVADESNLVNEYDKANNSAILLVSLNPSDPVVYLDTDGYTASENAGSVQITVVRGGDISAPATIRYATNNGTAKEGRDYIGAQGLLKFAANESTKTFSVLIIDNAFVDGPRTINVTLSDPTGMTLLSPNTAVLTITDNDSSIGLNPVDMPRSFVQLHYFDFLGRFPDQSGWDFWTNNITGCTPQPSCTDVQRINTSAAYFLSIEFQQTGYLVYRIYKASFGNLTEIPNAPVPIRLNEFLPDTQEIGNGVIVNQGNWQQQLEANKQAFTLEFVQRSRFATAFPTTMTPAQFVDKLFSNAGVTPTTTDRNGAIAEFGSATTTTDVAARSRALRDVGDNPALNTREFNKAFVLMQYFGYLRRNPYDSPDADYSGYNFWLNKLNQFNGNYIDAEMVKAFISSAEYRGRFGPNNSTPASNGAAFVTESVPTSVVAGQDFTALVKVRNGGSTTWTSEANYRLGSQGPQDNYFWGVNRGLLSNNVSPNSEVTFNLTLTAPATPGSYNFAWRMVQDGVEWFGDATPGVTINVTSPPNPTPNVAAFVSQSVAGSMVAGKTYTVLVTMKNTGSTTWTAADAYRLGSQAPQDNFVWGPNRALLPKQVLPGEEVTFTFDVTAPLTPGTYNFRWRMVRDGVEWFGDYSPNWGVNVM